jgi:hypothetical protein
MLLWQFLCCDSSVLGVNRWSELSACAAVSDEFKMSCVCLSAGKNDSIASSDKVTTIGVPNTVTVLINESSPSFFIRRRGMEMPELAVSEDGGVFSRGFWFPIVS